MDLEDIGVLAQKITVFERCGKCNSHLVQKVYVKTFLDSHTNKIVQKTTKKIGCEKCNYWLPIQ